MMQLLIKFIISIAAAELAVRILLALRYRTFSERGVWSTLKNPEGGMDWRIFSNFGEFKDRQVAKLFRFSTQAAFMKMTDEELQEIMAKANQTDSKEIKDVYFGAKSFERYKYRPYLGFYSKPNQELNYAKIDELGFQGEYKNFRKPPNTKRVLLYGGSVAYGIGCTAKEKNWGYQLQEILNEKEKKANSPTRWEVINLSFIASQSISELNQNLIFASMLAPDVIIELAGFNDMYFYLMREEANLYTYQFHSDVEDYLTSSFMEKLLLLIARKLFLVRVILKLSKWQPQKQEGQLYSVW